MWPFHSHKFMDAGNQMLYCECGETKDLHRHSWKRDGRITRGDASVAGLLMKCSECGELERISRLESKIFHLQSENVMLDFKAKNLEATKRLSEEKNCAHCKGCERHRWLHPQDSCRECGLYVSACKACRKSGLFSGKELMGIIK